MRLQKPDTNGDTDTVFFPRTILTTNTSDENSNCYNKLMKYEIITKRWDEIRIHLRTLRFNWVDARMNS